MKRFTYTVFVAFWSAALTIVGLHAVTPTGRAASRGGDLPTYTLEEVAAHDTLDDCWMAIEGKVYDFTGYIGSHPTPSSVLEPWCGRESTEGMRTKGYGRDHSEAAWAMVEDYLVGRLAE